jgi:hypothetical protein
VPSIAAAGGVEPNRGVVRGAWMVFPAACVSTIDCAVQSDGESMPPSPPPLYDGASMAKKKIKQLPQTVQTREVGVLSLTPYGVYTGKARVRRRLAKVVVWVDDDDVGDPGTFGDRVDAVWREMMASLESILDAAPPVVQEALDKFWQIDDEKAPTVATLMKGGIRQVAISVSTKRPSRRDEVHRLSFEDDADVIGGHDLFIQINADFKPTGAYFDG